MISRFYAQLLVLVSTASAFAQIPKIDPNQVVIPKVPNALQSIQIADRLQIAAPTKTPFTNTVSVRDAKNIRFLLQPQGDPASYYLYQASLVPLDNSSLQDKVRPLVLSSGPLSPGLSQANLSNIWPEMPALNKLTKINVLWPLKPKSSGGIGDIRKSSPYGTVVAPSVQLLQQIQETGKAVVYIRAVGINKSGSISKKSNTVKLILTDPVKSDAICRMSFVDRSKGGDLNREDFPIVWGDSATPKTIKVRYKTTSTLVKSMAIQVSRTQFSDNDSTWSSPKYNARVAVVPPKVSPASANQIPDFQEIDLDVSGMFGPVTTKEQPLYIRAVAVDSNGQLVATPSNPILWRCVSTPLKLTPAPPPATPSPTPRMVITQSVQYVPPIDRDPNFERRVVTSRVATGLEANVVSAFTGMKEKSYPAGTKVFLPVPKKEDKSLFEAVADVVKGFINALASIVDWASQMYAKLQMAIVSAVADFTGLPPEVVNFALQCAMSAIGLPPQLPNFDQLMDQGLDYMVATACQQAGFPDSEMLQGAMKDGLKQMAAAMKDPPPGAPLFIPDRDFDDKPAVLKFTFKAKWDPAGTNTPPVKSAPRTIPIDASAQFPPDPSSIGLNYATSEQIFVRELALPAMSDGQSMSVTIPVTPNDPYWLNTAKNSKLNVLWRIGFFSKTAPVATAWSGG